MLVTYGVGGGCRGYPIRDVSMIVHNPSPSTPRGKRRFAALSEGDKNARNKRYLIERSVRRSKKQNILESAGGVA